MMSRVRERWKRGGAPEKEGALGPHDDQFFWDALETSLRVVIAQA